MDYHEKLIFGTELIDASLRNLGIPCLSQNGDFLLSSEHHYSDYVKYSIKKTNSVYVEIVISTSSIQINIEEMHEVFDWSIENCSGGKDEIIVLLEMLFSYDVVIEYCGKNYRKISFIDQKGNCVRSCKYVTGFYTKIKCFTKNFKAIYKKM